MTTYTKNDVPIRMYILTKKQKLKKKKKNSYGYIMFGIGCWMCTHTKWCTHKKVQTNKKMYGTTKRYTKGVQNSWKTISILNYHEETKKCKWKVIKSDISTHKVFIAAFIYIGSLIRLMLMLFRILCFGFASETLFRISSKIRNKCCGSLDVLDVLSETKKSETA